MRAAFWLTSMCGSILLSSRAMADFTGLTWEDVSREVGTPDGYITVRVYANFSEPDEQVFVVFVENVFFDIPFLRLEAKDHQCMALESCV